MAGAPSQLEMFDDKPELAKFDGTLPPAELIKDYRAAFIEPNSTLLGPRFKFSEQGKCGAECQNYYRTWRKLPMILRLSNRWSPTLSTMRRVRFL